MEQTQESQSRTGGCTGLISGMIYFDTSQYRCTVSDLLLFFYIYKYIYIYVCMYVCVYIYYNKYKSLT